MKVDSIKDSTRYVVADIHHGGIFPETRTAMGRNVYLLTHADVRGGIWANELSLKGPDIKVWESVYCKGPVSIEEGEKDLNNQNPIIFGSCVSSPDSILVRQSAYKIRFLSDIYTGRLNVSNSIVYGNVFANNAIIHDSIVLGGVFCQNKLAIDHSMVSTFRAKKVDLKEEVFLFFPFALAEEPIQIRYPIKALTFYSLLRDINVEEKTDGVILFDQDDVFELINPGLEESLEYLKESETESKIFCLSITERILDANEIFKHFRYNQKFLENLALGNHIDPSNKEKNYAKPIEELENKLWEILRPKKEYHEVKGSSNLKDLSSRPDVIEVIDQTLK